MTRELGSYNIATARTHVRFQFSTHAGTGGNVAPSSAFEAADLRIYRAADSAAYSATERTSASGITMTSPFDSLVGVHDVAIDLTDDTHVGFYAAGYRYSVVLAPDETIDGETITGVVLAEFEIGPPPVNTVQISGDQNTADYLEALSDGAITGTADSGTTTTMVDTERTEAASYWPVGSVIIWTSGSNAGLESCVTAWDSGTDTLTFVPALPNTVAAGHQYEIKGQARVDAQFLAGQTITAAAGVTFPTSVASPTNITAASGVALTSAYDLYHAEINVIIDDSNSQDEYTITWFKNGARVTSGITSPTLQVVKRADGADLIASTTPTQIASTGSYKHDATTSARLTAGQAALAVVTATIDAGSRSFSKLVGRDS
jgi:hypothetical protein